MWRQRTQTFTFIFEGHKGGSQIKLSREGVPENWHYGIKSHLTRNKAEKREGDALRFQDHSPGSRNIPELKTSVFQRNIIPANKMQNWDQANGTSILSWSNFSLFTLIQSITMLRQRPTASLGFEIELWTISALMTYQLKAPGDFTQQFSATLLNWGEGKIELHELYKEQQSLTDTFWNLSAVIELEALSINAP